MQLRTLGTFGLGTAVGAVVTALATGTLAGPGPVRSAVADGAGTALDAAAGLAGDVAAVVGPPPAAAAQLPAFDGCEELRRWYVDRALPQVGPWGFGGPFVPYLSRVAGQATRDSLGVLETAAKAVGNGDTGTNVQEQGVDEPDRVKTDGRVLYRVVGDTLVATDVTGEAPRPLARVEIPGPWMDAELLLVGDTLLVVGSNAGPSWGRGDVVTRSVRMVPPGSGHAWVVGFDVSDPSAPQVSSTQRLDGSLVAARGYADGTVRLVLSTAFPRVDFVRPTRDRSHAEARRTNRQLVRELSIEQWLPGVRTNGAERTPLLGCDDVRHPRSDSGFGTISLLTFPASDPRSFHATAVTAAGELVYSSTDRIYVATLPGGFWAGTANRAPARTQVHAFAVQGTETAFVASGSVPGTVRDRWSFDEHDGRLRVASALGRSWSPRENAVSVLEEQDGRLEVVGSVDGLGPRESIRSVRWFDDLAVVVTFREVDPLYTVDLADPRRPRVLGELKIPGFSAYLHPLGDDLLLGVGQHATPRGRDLGAQVASFDLADLTRVQRLDTHTFGRHSWQGAGDDPRSFTYLPEARLAFVAHESWRTGGTTVTAFRVADDGALTTAGDWSLARWYAAAARVVPLEDGRVAVVGSRVELADLS